MNFWMERRESAIESSRDDDSERLATRVPTAVLRETAMTMFHPVDLGALLDFSLRIALAFVLATAIGAERQFRERGQPCLGLNTAATLWRSAAVGALCGVNLAAEAGVLTIAVLAGNTLLRPLANTTVHPAEWMLRSPLVSHATWSSSATD
jgi:hypothetical protein